MEALWNLEDKWNLSTQAAALVFSCTAFLLLLLLAGICAGASLRRRSNENIEEPGAVARGSRVKKGLMGSVRWSKASKWEGGLRASRKEQPTPLLGGGGGEVGWPSHNAASPVWQRPILMGDKCELPRFSGLILYDQSGKPLDQIHSTEIQEQPTVRATLRDLL